MVLRGMVSVPKVVVGEKRKLGCSLCRGPHARGSGGRSSGAAVAARRLLERLQRLLVGLRLGRGVVRTALRLGVDGHGALRCLGDVGGRLLRRRPPGALRPNVLLTALRLLTLGLTALRLFALRLIVLRLLRGMHHATAATATRRPRHVTIIRRLVRVLVPRLGDGICRQASQGIAVVGALITVVTLVAVIAGRFTTIRLRIIRPRLVGSPTHIGGTATTGRRTTTTATATRRTRLLRLCARHRLVDGALLLGHLLGPILNLSVTALLRTLARTTATGTTTTTTATTRTAVPLPIAGRRTTRAVVKLFFLHGIVGILRRILGPLILGVLAVHRLRRRMLARRQIATTATTTPLLLLLLMVDRIDVNDQATAIARLTRRGERLQQSGAQTLAGHLHQTQRRHLRHLMARAVPAQRLLQTAQHQIPVLRQHHVDEVDDDHAAEIAQPHLADDLLRRLQVVAGHRLLEIAAGTGELAGVDVDDRHRLGALDDQRAARRQPHLPVQRLGQLLVDAVMREHVLAAVLLGVVALQTIRQIRGDLVDVGTHHGPRLVALDDQAREILVEQVADDLDQHVGLFVHGHRLGTLAALRLRGALVDVPPQPLETIDVGGDGLLGHTLRGGADDRARPLRRDLLQNLLQALALRLRQLAGNARAVAARHVHQETAGQGNLHRQAGALVAHRVLGHLHQHLVAGLERVLDAPRPAGGAERTPIDVRRVQHAVAVGADVDERRLHARQHVLHAAEVDVADDRRLRVRGDEMLDEQLVLQHADLRDHAVAVVAVAFAHHHRAFDGFAAGEELGFRDDVALAGFGAAIGATAALGLQSRRALDGHRFVDDRHLRLRIVVPLAAGCVVLLDDARVTALRRLEIRARGVPAARRITVGRVAAGRTLATPTAATATATAARAGLATVGIIAGISFGGVGGVGAIGVARLVGGITGRIGVGPGRGVRQIVGDDLDRLRRHEHRNGERRFRRRRGDRRDDLHEVIVLRGRRLGGRGLSESRLRIHGLSGRGLGGRLNGRPFRDDGLLDLDLIGILRGRSRLGRGALGGAAGTRTPGGLLRRLLGGVVLLGLVRGGRVGLSLGLRGFALRRVFDGLVVSLLGGFGLSLGSGLLGRLLCGLLRSLPRGLLRGGLLLCLLGGLFRRLFLGRSRLHGGRLPRRAVVKRTRTGHRIQETIPILGPHRRRRRRHHDAQLRQGGDHFLRRDAHGLRQGMHAHPLRRRPTIEITGTRHGVIAEIQHDMRFSSSRPAHAPTSAHKRRSGGRRRRRSSFYPSSVVVHGVLRSTSSQ